MKLNRLELSALLGMQARNRELVFMGEQIKSQLEQLEEESQELFSDIEIRLEIEPDTLMNYDVNSETGELLVKKDEDEQEPMRSFAAEASLNGGNRKSKANIFDELIPESEDIN